MSENLLEKYAKSFNWAGFFLPKEEYKKSLIVYNYCRTLDDIVDKNKELYLKFYNDPSGQYNGLSSKEILRMYKTHWKNRTDFEPLTRGMWKLFEKENISKKIVEDLFDGLESDLSENIKIKTKKDLLTYCYRVAGTVGLMMSKILKVKNKEALKGAIDLGIAMQLTNIARDVCEDKARNRKYIEHNFSSIREIIRESEIFYENSFNSIKHIPMRSRFSVIVARRIYRKIGDYILKQNNIDNYNKASKIYVPIFEKVIQTFLSIIDFIKLLFIKNLNYNNQLNHNILKQEINLNERI